MAQFDICLKEGQTATNLPVQMAVQDVLIMEHVGYSPDREVRCESQRPYIHDTHPIVCGLFQSGTETNDYPGLTRKSTGRSLAGFTDSNPATGMDVCRL